MNSQLQEQAFLRHLVTTVLYGLFLVLSLPLLLRVLPTPGGKIAFGLLAAGGVGLGWRLRVLAREVLKS